MQKITKILVETEGLLGNESASTTAADLNRIANALERIAVSLEKLTGDKPQIPEKSENSSNLTIIEKYLNQRGIAYKLKSAEKVSKEHRVDLNSLALYLGKNYKICESLYKALKGNSKTPQKEILYSLTNSSVKEKVKLRAFCGLLMKAQILEDFINTDSPQKQLVLNPTGKEIKFLNGAWLENYAEVEIQRIVKNLNFDKPNNQFELQSNIEISFQTGANTELDVLFRIGREIFCIEAKTHPNLKSLKTKLNQMKSVGLSYNHMLILSVSTPDETFQKFSEELHGVKIARLENFEAALTEMIKAACGL